jgi:hypothetical protein
VILRRSHRTQVALLAHRGYVEDGASGGSSRGVGMADLFYFTSLTLENVRAFAGAQTLKLINREGKPSRWCVILGDNGVGKTTLMQALAVMRPKPAFARNRQGRVTQESAQKGGEEALKPIWIEPELTAYENAQIERFARRGTNVEAGLTAKLSSSGGTEIELGMKIVMEEDKLASADAIPGKHALGDKGPLIITYGATRHAGDQNVAIVTELDPTAALFDERIELSDINEVLETLDYAELAASRDKDKDEQHRVGAFRKALLEAITAIIPEGAINIALRGPRLPGSARGGIWVETPSGEVPLADLSLGYRTTISWVADLAWRLFTQRPKSSAPLQENAIVLIDEIDLHLHPRWQRELRQHLLCHFPNIQFIVTSHSPFIAQESIAQGDPVAVVRWEGDHATIANGPLAPRSWRFDEVVVEAFDVEPPVDTEATRKLRRRRELLQRSKLRKAEESELDDLNAFVHGLQENGSQDAAFDRLLARLKELEAQLEARQ